MLDLRRMSREEIKKRLQRIRSQRKEGYTKKPRKSSRTPILPSLEGIDESVAMKILDELLAEEN